MKIAITMLVIAHLVAALWHGDSHSSLEIILPGVKNAFIYVVIIAGPLLGVVLLWTRSPAIGAGLVAVCMVGALAFGVYHHYVLVSPDNIAHLPVGGAEAHTQFIDSAAMIAILELVSAMFGFYVLGRSHDK